MTPEQIKSRAARQEKYRKSHRNKMNADAKKWREEHPEQWTQINNKYRWKKYGVTLEDINAMILNQKGMCAICNDKMTEPHLDHNHKTGKVRGLLCFRCNTGLGLLRDNPTSLLRAVEYLK